MALRILARTPLRLCDSLRCPASDLRFYSTQRADSVASKDTTSSDSVSKKKDELKRRAAYKRQWRARKSEEDPEYRAKESQFTKEWFAHKRATDSEWVMAYRQNRRARYYENHEAFKEYSRQYNQLRTAEDPLFKMKRYIRKWITRNEWFRGGLDWTSWRPIFYPTKVQHRCQECGTERHRGSRLWWKLEESQDFTCHSCYMKQSDGGLPKGYEGCTTLEELADRQKALDSQPLQGLTARGSTGQSWKPPRTSSPNSRSFSTLCAAWSTPHERIDIKKSPDRDSQSQARTPSEADVLEAKRQYYVTRDAWKLAQDVDPQALEKRAADTREAQRAWRRTEYAWKKANDTDYLARRRAYNRATEKRPARRESKYRYKQLPENRERNISHLRSQRGITHFSI